MTQQEQGRSTSQRSLPSDSLLQSYLACDQAAVAEKLLHELIGAARLIIESIVRRRLVFYSASKIQDREDLCGEVIVELPRPLLPRLVISLALAACFAALGCNPAGCRQAKAVNLQAPVRMRFTGFAFWDGAHWSRKDPQRGNSHGTKMVGTLWELHPAWRACLLLKRAGMGPIPFSLASGPETH